MQICVPTKSVKEFQGAYPQVRTSGVYESTTMLLDTSSVSGQHFLGMLENSYNAARQPSSTGKGQYVPCDKSYRGQQKVWMQLIFLTLNPPILWSNEASRDVMNGKGQMQGTLARTCHDALTLKDLSQEEDCHVNRLWVIKRNSSYIGNNSIERKQLKSNTRHICRYWSYHWEKIHLKIMPANWYE